MEQYIQMLIPGDARFAPSPQQIAAYFEMLAESWKYEIARDQPHIHGLRVFKHISKAEVEQTIKATGMFPHLKRLHLNGINEIPGAMEGLSGCSVSAIGHFRRERAPIKIEESAWPTSSKGLYCSLGCDLRPEPVLTSSWWTNEDDSGLLQFGDPAEPLPSSGTFTHPVSRRNIRIQSAGCARFWLGFDFGEWLLPYLPEDFDLLDAAERRKTILAFKWRKWAELCRSRGCLRLALKGY